MGTDVKDVLRRIKEADLFMQLNPSNPDPDVKHQYTLPLVSGTPAHLLNPDPEYYQALSVVEPATAAAAAATDAEQSKDTSLADC
ncbi:hypothetical protein COCSADRAFT_346202 [Bipolaris sorokiniana ND90Pr]|nr:uncharacterized protein COCSADRAFT_346202 [Bipolaris sorokiniana ND90Pr]EMD59876.1 hypothetical protein COCSADRAFT_346202 [Bipolaris sorokiniana ND90Pr]